MTQEQRQNIALMRYSVIAPLITGILKVLGLFSRNDNNNHEQKESRSVRRDRLVCGTAEKQ